MNNSTHTDCSVEHQRNLSVSQQMLTGLVRLYQLTLSPLIGGQCRFYPTCSHYATEAIARHGALRGVWLAVKRLAKCQPFHPGGVDLVPDVEQSRTAPTHSCNHS